ncbi:hypothetical protein GCM10028805_21410 [Spirosoma harenae]
MNQRRAESKDFLLRLSLFFLLTICLILTIVIRFRLIFLANSDIGGIESNVIYSIQRYLAGYSLYSNPEVAPYSITQYSPFYYRIVAFIGQLLDLDPDNTLQIYRVSRFLSLLANLLYALVIAGICRRFQLNLFTAILVAMTAFVLLPPQTYSRPDSVYTLLVLCALYAGVRTVQAQKTSLKNRWLVIGIVASALAIATKQSGIVLPAIYASYFLFLERNWLKGIIVGACIGLLSLLLLYSLMPEHDLVLLYANIVTGVSQGLDWSSYKINIFDHYLRPFGLHNALGIAISFWLTRQSRADYRWLGYFVLVLFGFASLTGLKQGSALNYYTEFVSLAGLEFALWLKAKNDLKLEKWGVGTPLLVLSVVFWAVIPNITNFNWPMALKRDAMSDQPYLEQKKVADYVKDSLSLKPTDAVFITNYNYCYLNGLLYRNCILPQQEIVIVMYPRKELNYEAFNKQIHQGAIRFLITRPNETTTPFPGLTTANYILRRKFPEFDVYERKQLRIE